MGFVPYVIPGFALAKLSAEVFEAKPDVVGLILHKHGIFTFAETAREAYQRMIEWCRVPRRTSQGPRNVFAAAALPRAPAPLADVRPHRTRLRWRYGQPPRMPSRSVSCSSSAAATRS
jgi:rhamnose utilization protein RhaD (predicted bifunctional aldolase and dehydrogenase)